MSEFRYENGQFIIENYDNQKPFASFLPGVAGLNGIPTWVYYTNRGQGIAGFGVENKNGAIFDFVPANVAYKRTELNGFRTFVKANGRVHELFSSFTEDDVLRKMVIEANSVGFIEVNKTLGIEITVKYFTVTEATYPGLIRRVSFTNLSGSCLDLEIVDGLMTMWPYKNDDFVIKSMSNLAVAWFETYNAENHMPFFRNRATTDDSAAVGSVEAGHFYAAYSSISSEPLPVIFDPDILFGEQTGLIRPTRFVKEALCELLKDDQVSANKLPCAFSAYVGKLEDTLTISSVLGKVSTIDQLKSLGSEFSINYFNQMEARAYEVIDHLLRDVEGTTAYPAFDAYIKQCYLDNFLRGGYPLLFEGKQGPIVYHVYSRIHGDMEREYNDFYVEPAYYSHGNGNFRDVNQNRRSDVYFVKEAGLYNIKQFMDLLQLDGQNPLVIKGSRLSLSEADAREVLNGLGAGAGVGSGTEALLPLLTKSFTPGELLTATENLKLNLGISNEAFLALVLKKAVQENQAAYGHGFWVDHWTYNMDLVDNYLCVFPDLVEELLYKEDFKYFKSPDRVLPRHKKYVVTAEGKVRQYDAIFRDENQLALEGFDCDGTNWTTLQNGSVLRTNLAVKLLILTLNKMTNFDPSGLGIMMNSDKPGWNDAMNGLPGLFGSSVSEVIEIQRVIAFLIDGLTKFPRTHQVIEEVAVLMVQYQELLEKKRASKIDALSFWEGVQTAAESYLASIEAPISGATVAFSNESVIELLSLMKESVEDSIERASQIGEGIIPSYFIHEATDYVVNEGQFHPVNGLQTVTVKAWKCRRLPHYLEAPARYLKQLKHKEQAQLLFHNIKNSGMYDEKLKMYVTSESLEGETLEIGRTRAFTPGWLERESVFMHMSYKYLLGLLKSGLYSDYYTALDTALPPFMDPAVYGRSILENSSFIASSRNPNPKNHGRGFVSRLTGTTSEMITMWLYMMTGPRLFSCDGELSFQLMPILRSDYFNSSNQVSFTLFKDILVTYDNPKRKNTFGQDGVSPSVYHVAFKNGESMAMSKVTKEVALKIRNGEVSHIQVILE